MSTHAGDEQALAVGGALPIDEASQVGDARRVAIALARAVGLDERARGEVGLVATELAGNLAKHARSGVLVVQPLAWGDQYGVELLAVDGGPGMADPAACLVDGYSTAGTPGTGLGAARRVASEFALDSRVGQGTVLLASVLRQRGGRTRPVQPGWLERPGAVQVPAPGERVCGDAWAVVPRANGRGREMLLVVDGLGHGPVANQAAVAAVRAFHEHAATASPADLLERLHAALRATRGAAVGIALVDPVAQELRFAGVGNIAGSIIAGGASRSTVSHNGIVGHQMQRVAEFTYPCPPRALVVLASDGLKTQWKLDTYPGLVLQAPSVVAATLWRDNTRVRDDATVLVRRVPADA